jgi:hypothetical protein
VSPLLVALVVAALGLAFWIAPFPPKAQEAGRWLFMCGVVFALLAQRGGLS